MKKNIDVFYMDNIVNKLMLEELKQRLSKIKVDGVLTNSAAVSVDEFFGSLGMTQYYPHRDNTYTGDLNG